ncbi:hypothetical protein [Coleofasciculus chthonoplastes]|uniref:hypothetical protein n=1 Tax=Coleofasciculus chthonoplastes TaxID=64178 RepID=UPI0032F540EB
MATRSRCYTNKVRLRGLNYQGFEELYRTAIGDNRIFHKSTSGKVYQESEADSRSRLP